MNAYTRLAKILAELYPSEDETILFMAQAGIDSKRIHTEQQASTRWYFIVSEARKADLIPALIQAALAEYPNHTELSALADGNTAIPTRPKEPMRIFLVSPKSDLEFAPSEVQDVLNSGLDVAQTLLDDVTYTQFVREIKRVPYVQNGGVPYVLWLAMHGSVDGWQLKDGLLDGFALASLVRGRFRYVYLNTCQSVTMAQILQNDGAADVVCTISDVPDLGAYRTGSLMASALAQTENFRSAYERSKPGNNTDYLYLASTDFLAQGT